MRDASFILRTLAIIAMLDIRSVQAHCQLAWPYALHSQLNPATPEAVKDYSMKSPLVTDGTYPCKGFINSPSGSPYMDSTITWSAGSTVNYTIAGSATHGGGSCQLSMSYDLGKSWNVIFSQIGGCLIDGMTTSVVIPPEAPSGEALLSWSWFNLLGNREMYQNCAVITITDGFSGLTGPAPFVANAGVNNCHTIENIAVVFEHPGNNVVYGGAYASTKPTTPAGFTGSNCVGPEAAGLDTSTVSISSSQISSQSSTASSQSASGTLVAIVHASTAPSATSITSSEATLSRTRPVGA